MIEKPEKPLLIQENGDMWLRSTVLPVRVSPRSAGFLPRHSGTILDTGLMYRAVAYRALKEGRKTEEAI